MSGIEQDKYRRLAQVCSQHVAAHRRSYKTYTFILGFELGPPVVQALPLFWGGFPY